MSELAKIPTIQDLFLDKETAVKNDQLVTLLNQEPNAKWIKVHPFIKGWQYIPIDKIEYMLRKIFKKYKIEILREGTAFNGVYVVVRVWYLNPISNEMEYHDGLGAAQLQTKQGSSPADLGNINNGALSMAFPIAETYAIKDACDKFGKLFGSDLNRKDIMSYGFDTKLSVTETNESKERNRIVEHIKNSKSISQLEKCKSHVDPEIDFELFSAYIDKENEFKN